MIDSQPKMPDPENIPLAAAVLDYATYDADGLPPWVAEAEALIDVRAKPKKLRKFFRNADQAARYFAKSMRRRFAIDRLGDHCVACDAPYCRTAAGVEWIVRMPLKWSEFRLSRKLVEQTFVAYHPMCADCFTPWRKTHARIRLAARVFHNLRWGWLVFVIIVAMAPQISPTLRGPWIAVISSAYFPFLLLIIFSRRLLAIWARLRIPQGLRKSLPPTLRVNSLPVFDVRENLAAPQAIALEAQS
ncbi:hypothetical protein BH10PLA1_BH10PLA1_04450 [soil metagenome]